MNAPCPTPDSSARKPIFDKVREFIGRSFKQSEVRMIDGALDALLPNSCPRQVSEAGIALIKRFEGCARLRTDGLVEAYPDPGTGGAPYTIGWGATGPDIDAHTVWSQEQCNTRLEQDIARHARDVRQAIGDTPTTQAQFDALVSFHYNTGAIGRATLTEKHKALDFAGAADEFQRWNRAGGRILKGLVRRRGAEAKLYRGSFI
ncbi:lysozyme [Altererythrobacter lutimaris]|uniref:Lysozyme n=1 Tax=Altererythrobacter lutimaris TaxID=2743979 RepID=A0A850HHQ8_9SPHN|nr:lysozyme [Altererythrobacter lutimaris]NVE94722.1 lysozyme [Altererythrobacter lutimaris]